MSGRPDAQRSCRPDTGRFDGPSEDLDIFPAGCDALQGLSGGYRADAMICWTQLERAPIAESVRSHEQS